MFLIKFLTKLSSHYHDADNHLFRLKDGIAIMESENIRTETIEIGSNVTSTLTISNVNQER